MKIFDLLQAQPGLICTDLIARLQWLLTKNIKSINISLQEYAWENECDVRDIVAHLVANGVKVQRKFHNELDRISLYG